ncbi:glycerophosphodiester phosphodiesterase [Myxococcota bacterium]|nr:glycerophosphodiester phosphodiesterase [Myxococcota bacterium]
MSLVALLLGLSAPVAAATAHPLVIGHRGAPGTLPDHTLEGYRLAVALGADAIEPDLVSTRDGVLVARHENELSLTTDVAARFPDRKRTQVVDGEPVEGWFVEDLTLAELRTLRAVQPWAERPHDHDGLYPVPTFDEVLALADALQAEAGRTIQVVPELKHGSHFQALGLPLEPRFEQALARWGGDRRRVIVQSFELANLAAMSPADGRTRLFLVDDLGRTIPGDVRSYGQVLADLPALRRDAEAIGVSRDLLWGPRGPTDLLARAHAAGLAVFVWTLRAERPGPAAQGGGIVAEAAAFTRLGVDGIFADQPDLAVQGRAAAGR